MPSPTPFRILAAALLGAGTAFAALADGRHLPVPVQPPGVATRDPGKGQDTADERQQGALAALRRLAGASPVLARFEGSQPRVLQAMLTIPGADSPARARAFVDTYGKALWRLGAQSELRAIRTDPATGLVHFSQRYRGLPVLGGDLAVFTSAKGVYGAIGSLLPGDGLETLPLVPERKILEMVAKPGDLALAPPMLAIGDIPQRVVNRDGSTTRVHKPFLVWAVSVRHQGRAFRNLYDARTATLVRSSALDMDSAAAFDEYEAEWFDSNQDAYDSGCQGDQPNVDEAGDDDGLLSPYLAKPDYVMGWTHARRAYAFYYDFFGRLSYDGSDGPILGYQESANTDNAFWSQSCEEINWAPDYGSSDTPVHEMTHGVTQFTSGLEYYGETGGMNESFSDVMAATADNDGDGRWSEGEDNVNGGGAIRSLENPNRDHASDIVIDSDDNGGVHRNSGVGNKVAFLLAEGGIHPQSNYPVTGIGVTKMGRLMYASYTSLSEYSDYDDLRNTAVVVAQYWSALGIHGFTASHVCSVRNAFAAVGVDGRSGSIGIKGGDTDCDGVENETETDDDNDGVADGSDNCRSNANPSQTDTDGDGNGDACDADDDADGVADTADNCPVKKNANQLDGDHDGIGDVCDDSDHDGVLDSADNCPTDYNPGQADSGGDPTAGDVCDPDTDGDGVFNVDGDNCPVVFNPDQADTDGDLYGDACDGCPGDADTTPAMGFNGMPFEPDSDGDGTPDQCDTSWTLGSAPIAGGISASPDRRKLTWRLDGLSRTSVPLVTCPEPCAEVDSSPLLGQDMVLDLGALPAGVTALVTDEGGLAVARPQHTEKGNTLMRFSPRGARRYFLTFQGGQKAPTEGSLLLKSFGRATPKPSPANLGVSIADSPDPVKSGGTVKYVVDVTNAAMAPAKGVHLLVTPPAGSELQSDARCRLSGGVLDCPMGTVDPGAKVSRSFKAQVFGRSATLSARITSTTPDPDTSDNADTETTRLR